MSARKTSQVVGKVFLESDIKVEGVNYQSAAIYVKFGMSDSEIRARALIRVVPVRRYTWGKAPGITSAEAMHKEAERDKDKWIFPDIELTNPERQSLIAAVLEIGVRTM